MSTTKIHPIPQRGDLIRLAALTLDDLIEWLGAEKATVKAWIRDRSIPATRWCGRTLYVWDEISSRVAPKDAARLKREAVRRGYDLSESRYTLAGYPTAVRLWDRERNGLLTPWHVSYASSRSIWFRCPEGPDHLWERQAAVVTNTGKASDARGCPFCGDLRLSVTNSLAVQCPELASEWHAQRNGELTPRDVTPISEKVVWWQCPHGSDHVWKRSIRARAITGLGCPYCSARRASETTSLATLFPNLAAEWHPTQNGQLTPNDVVAGSGRRVWWRCGKVAVHQWQAKIYDRTKLGRGCPYCNKSLPSHQYNAARLAPWLVREWHPTLNGTLSLEKLLPASSRSVWWRCKKDPSHEWQATVATRLLRGCQCPICCGRKLAPSSSLATRFPDLAAQWHPTRNGDLTPHDVVAGSNRRVWWTCPKGPDHEWEATLNNRVHHGHGCPMCRGLKPSVTNSLASLHPSIAAQWHPTENSPLRPDQVTVGSNKKVTWLCPADSRHVWKATVASRVSRPGRCPFCIGQRACPSNSLGVLYANLARDWDPSGNGDKSPLDVVPGSHYRAWWICSTCGHRWQARIADRTGPSSLCPACARAAEARHRRR